MAKKDAKQKNTPVFTAGPYSAGSGSLIEAAVWSNLIEVDGGQAEVFAVSFKRSYRDGEQWKTSKTLRIQDIPLLMFALQRCQEYILETHKNTV